MNPKRLEAGTEPFPGLRLLQRLGRGGFGEVWEARDANKNRIAVKFMPCRNASSSVKEMKIIQSIQKLHHRNLLKIEHVMSIPDYIVVVMEVADGSLHDVLDVYQAEYQTALGGQLTVSYLRGVAAALDFLNARRHTFEGKNVGFQHCDVKPSNLLLVVETVKLADFGLCTPTVPLQSNYGRAGTLDFAAPEVHRGNLTETSDQYSLAVTYYFLRTGTLPFPATLQGFQRAYSYSRPAPDLSQVSRSEARVLEKALDLEPSSRWPSCAMMMANLELAVKPVEPEASARVTDRRLASSRH